MTKVLSPGDYEKYKVAYHNFSEATRAAGVALELHGMDSAEFRDADSVAGRYWRETRDLLGISGQSWMA